MLLATNGAGYNNFSQYAVNYGYLIARTNGPDGRGIQVAYYVNAVSNTSGLTTNADFASFLEDNPDDVRPRAELAAALSIQPCFINHPMSPFPRRHRAELERRFAANVAECAAGLVKGWKDGSIVLVADPKMLGLAREGVRAVAKGGVSVKELADTFARAPALSGSDSGPNTTGSDS